MEKYFLNWYPILATREKMLLFVKNNTKLNEKQKERFIDLWYTASGVDSKDHLKDLPVVDGCLNGCDCECEDCDEYTCNCDCDDNNYIESMTKLELEAHAISKYNVDIDRRLSKETLIKQINELEDKD